MNIEELTAQYYLEKDCNCAETVLHAANDAYQLGLDDNAMKVIGGFGGRLRLRPSLRRGGRRHRCYWENAHSPAGPRFGCRQGMRGIYAEIPGNDGKYPMQ